MTEVPSDRPPRVSIVIPAYNCARLLGRTLDSVLAQTVTDWELVVFDDGSTDSTADVADRYARAEPRIRVVRATNGGVAAARNRGFAHTDPRSEFVTFLDHDDRWFPDTLESLIAVLEARPDLVSVYGLARCIDGEDRLVPGDDMEERMRERFEYRGRSLVAISPDEPTTFAGLMYHNYPTTPGLHLVRRRVREEVGSFDPDMVPADDWDMNIRISRFGPIGLVDRVVLEWRRHPDVLSYKSPWRRAYYRVRAKTFAAPQNTPEQRRLARTAYLAPSREAFRRGWTDLRARELGAAARSAEIAAESAVRYALAAAPVWVRGPRSGRPHEARA
jgi:glycosyltransferase involved in cell wall biosynthesis